MTDYFIGVDGGGTKTRGVISTPDGELVAHTIVGSTNYHSVGLEEVERRLKEIMDQLAGHERMRSVKYICLGLSGVGRPIDYERIGGVLERLGIIDKSFLTNDAVIALWGGTLKDRGILVIAGTGSIVYGMRGEEIARAGGYGQLLGDEGSGYRLGLKGLITVLKAYDGRIKETALTQPILERLGIESPMNLVTWIGGLKNVKEEVGKLAPIVLEAAEEGDEPARKVVEEEVSELAQAVSAVARRLGFPGSGEKYEVVFTGGVLKNSKFYSDLLSEEIRKELPDAETVRPKAPAVIGALLIAMRKSGFTPTEDVIKRMVDSWSRITNF